MSKIRSSRSRGGIGWRLVSTRTVGSIVVDMSRLLRHLEAVESAAAAGREPAGGEAREQDEEQQHERRRPGARVIRGSGDSESSKIATGIDCSAWCGFQLVFVPTIDDVKRSGAVSPATRATASTVPVTMPPIVCGRTMLSVVRQRGTPSARLASRSEFGTSASTSIVERATSGSIRHASANAPAQPLWPWPTTSEPEDEDADHDRRHAVQHVEREADAGPDRRRRELVQVDRDQDPDRQRHQRRERRRARASRRTRSRAPASTGPNANWTGSFVSRSRLSAPRASLCDRRRRR